MQPVWCPAVWCPAPAGPLSSQQGDTVNTVLQKHHLSTLWKKFGKKGKDIKGKGKFHCSMEVKVRGVLEGGGNEENY